MLLYLMLSKCISGKRQYQYHQQDIDYIPHAYTVQHQPSKPVGNKGAKLRKCCHIIWEQI